ncbi:MAG: 16S rRNA (cytosine(967)-C(5))-methyltransferase RsmB [Acidobacteria bacterium]|uniref:16S rRNA (cytosine(967)-C(5))-methyltransferase n=1 Tax=Candidatus Polarisedimenticola svalbardensis TaxID=2886004 RepID=A0A8J6Y4N7_9BACT|nr:16S rRNA (cytosine(967)-C(5))-methyltransferase RsmB [Candidatus Polarisedimenticola svalbardensis]
MAEQLDPRREAVRILDRVERGGAYASALLENVEPRFRDRRDRALLHALVLGVLRRRPAMDHAISRLSSRPLEEIDPELLQVLRVGAFMLLEMDRIPTFAVLDVMVSVAAGLGGPGTAGFVNGVLRALSRDLDAHRVDAPSPGVVRQLALALGHPAWWTGRVVERVGWDEAVELLEADNRPAPTVIRVNRSRSTPADLVERMSAEEVSLTACEYVPGAFRVEGVVQATAAFAEGLAHIQDEGSQLLPLLLGGSLSGRILDACAAPGGKTMVLAEMADQGSELVAVDRNESRLKKVTQNARRLGHEGIATVVADMATPAPSVEGKFDHVLVDAPCSGTGTLRRHPEIRWRLQVDDLARLAARQEKILTGAAALLAPGGSLVYGVCSMEHEEGAGVVAGFLERHPEFTVADPGPNLPESCRPLVGDDRFVRTSPVIGMDGFFGALLRRAE